MSSAGRRYGVSLIKVAMDGAFDYRTEDTTEDSREGSDQYTEQDITSNSHPNAVGVDRAWREHDAFRDNFDATVIAEPGPADG